MKQRKPNFFGIGAGKAGTTAVHYFLDQHPDIYMSQVKEPDHFSFEGGRQYSYPWYEDKKAYLALFESAVNESAVGEISNTYLTSEVAAKRIHEFAPDARLFVVLRDPAERAYSHFLMHLGTGLKANLDDFRCMFQSPNRLRPGLHSYRGDYLREGFYHQNLQKYQQLFSRHKIAILFYDDLKASPLYFIRELYQFLGVDDSICPKSNVVHNASGIPSDLVTRSVHGLVIRDNLLKYMLKSVVPNKVLHEFKLLIEKRLRSSSAWIKPKLDPETRSILIELYRKDIQHLQDEVDRNLSNWLTV